ncbi:hypothetical protein EJ06DRAFT_530697 [Trichodelitschia bisporula]|uniref:Nucleoporin Nup159/Nup146 N-terminal domain-containing protein n=1 Tax=Trichodelitschia bisporula TaxID=703511 RepID=A0A6G1HVM1_9PEZI|nr:hypothetical protein EJ06DRAFT_530697 [Trichodelitschia bisporula]
MAFSFANAASAVPGANAQSEVGQDLPEISTEALAFKTLAGDAKLRFLPSPWPANALPASTSSLFSITSAKGLVAAASPDTLVIATTDATRAAFDAPGGGPNNVKDFTPQLSIGVPRLSHVAFTSDGEYLVICAENGGGLAVYQTKMILQNNKEPSFQVGTGGISIRALAPNAAPEFAYQVAVVLSNGNLMLANLQEKQFVAGVNGNQVIKEGVTCASWSNRGKQVVVGLGDGTAMQLKPDGSAAAVIPRPPNVQPTHYVSSIVWLANDEFLMFHTPSSPDEPDRVPDSLLHHVKTVKERSNFMFRKLNDPAGPFGMNRFPPTHYVSRLRKCHHLLDTVMVTSVAALDVGLITQSDVPLSKDQAPTFIPGAYTTTTFADDSKRATLPMSIQDSMSDTTAIGMALDLSSKQPVPQPIVGDEMDYSPFPLPALMLLNHEGILRAWWFIYKDALRQNIRYPDSATNTGAVSKTQQLPTTTPTGSPFAAKPTAPAQASPFGALGSPGASAFGKPAFGAPAFGAPSFGAPTGGSAFGAPSGGSAFGAQVGGSAFGAPSQLGTKSAWGSPSTTQAAAFGKPAFAQASTFGQPPSSAPTAFGASAGSAFGATSAIGQKQSPWATQSTAGGDAPKSAPPFGSSASGPSGFAKLGANASQASPFAALPASTSAFAQSPKPSQPAFGSPSTPTPAATFGRTPEPSFGSTVTIDSSVGGSTLGGKSLFGTPAEQSSVFGQPSKPAVAQAPESDMMDDAPQNATVKTPASGLFGAPSEGFQVSSTFKPDPAPEGKAETAQESKGSMFGTGFMSGLSEPAQKSESVTPQPAVEQKSIFGAPSMNSPTPQVEEKKKKAPFSFVNPPKEASPSKDPEPTQQPLPPQVTSKPIPSPATLASSSAVSSAPPSNEQNSEEHSEVEEIPPLAGSPPVDVEELSDSADGSEDEESQESEESDEEEGSEVEVEEEAPLPPDPSTVKTPAGFYTSLPVSSGFVQTTTPDRPRPPPKAPSPPRADESPVFATTTPAGFPKAPAIFQAPVAADPPRSPSPIRSASTPVGRFGPQSQPSQQVVPRSSVIPEKPQREPTPEPSFTVDLSDDEDERIRAELVAPPEPTTKLEPFLAHQDYAGRVSKQGIPGQIERVYRDVNSMIDTLGLNARTLGNFLSGHMQGSDDKRCTVDDLEDDEDWTLVEATKLESIISRELEPQLEQARISDVGTLMGELTQMKKELLGTRNKLIEVRRFLEAQNNPARKASMRAAPLEPPHAALQQDLREKLSDFQKQLAQAEESLVVSRAKLATKSAGKNGSNMPTVEAVENTIKKLTGMVEKKSGDVDVLETQMRKLGLMLSGETPTKLRDSARFRSSIATPTKKGAGRTFSLEPEDDDDDAYESARKIATEEKVRQFKKEQQSMQAVLGQLRDAVLRKGGRITDAR